MKHILESARRCCFFVTSFGSNVTPSDQKATPVGRAGIQLRIDNKVDYLEYDLIESVRDWKYGWFYMENHPPSLAKHTGFAPRKRSQWRS